MLLTLCGSDPWHSPLAALACRGPAASVLAPSPFADTLPCAARFVHNESNPLEVDAVLVDETSMLDIALGLALLRALPKDRFCQLVLVGQSPVLLSLFGQQLQLMSSADSTSSYTISCSCLDSQAFYDAQMDRHTADMRRFCC